MKTNEEKQMFYVLVMTVCTIGMAICGFLAYLLK